MEIFATRLRERAAQLGTSDAEAARRVGLEERRYAHYIAGRREPDLTTLVRIAAGLGRRQITVCVSQLRAAAPWQDRH